jgi:hypothetical protein
LALPLIVFDSPSKENVAEHCRLKSSDFPSLPGLEGLQDLIIVFQPLIDFSPPSKTNNYKFPSLEHKGCRNEQGFQPLIVFDSPSKQNNSVKFKASPNFKRQQSLLQEGRRDEQNQLQGFQSLVFPEEIEASLEFKRLQSFYHEGHQDEPLISLQSKENNSEQFILLSSEFPSLPGLGQEQNQPKGFQLAPIDFSYSSKDNISEQFKLNPKYEWPRIDLQDKQEQNEPQGFKPLTGFVKPRFQSSIQGEKLRTI